MNGFLDEISKRILVFDGSKGYMLQIAGLKSGETSEHWNLTHPHEVTAVYGKYLAAGSDVIQTNTFPGNSVYLSKYGLEDMMYDINYEGTRLARLVAGDRAYIGASIGPTGELLEPMGSLAFDKAFSVFRQQAAAIAAGGADLITFETFSDLGEMRAAVLAASDVCSLPLACSMTFEMSGRTLMGNTAEICARVLHSLGAAVIGTNCSAGPGMLLDIIVRMHKEGTGRPLMVKPNAGLPDIDSCGNITYKETPEVFAGYARRFAENGARLIGGCCGTTPDHIAAIKKELKGIEPVELNCVERKCITSATILLNTDKIDESKIIKIDGNGSADLLRTFASGGAEAVADKASDIDETGHQAIYLSHACDDENQDLFPEIVRILQQYKKLPFIVRSCKQDILEKTLRLYNGIAGVSIKGFTAAEAAPLQKAAMRYGSCVFHEPITVI